MNGDLALQISQDEMLGRFIVISAFDLSPYDFIHCLVCIGRLLGVVE